MKKYLLLLMFVCLPLVSAGDPEVLEGLVSYYCMNDSGVGFQDCYGSNDGTVLNATWIANSKYNGCYFFNKTDSQWVGVPDSPTLRFPYNYTMSIISNRQADFATEQEESGRMTMVSKWNGSNVEFSMLWHSDSVVENDYPYLSHVIWRNVGGQSQWDSDATWNTSSSTYEHVVLVRNVSQPDGFRLISYVNNTNITSSHRPLGQFDDGTIIKDSTDQMTIGKTDTGGNSATNGLPHAKYFNGTMCNIALWDRTLNHTELEGLYNASGDPFNVTQSYGTATTTLTSGLLFWYDFENTTSPDDAGNEGDATLVGGGSLIENCVIGNCWDLTADGSYLTIPDTANVDFLNEYTTLAWLQCDNWGDGGINYTSRKSSAWDALNGWTNAIVQDNSTDIRTGMGGSAAGRKWSAGAEGNNKDAFTMHTWQLGTNTFGGGSWNGTYSEWGDMSSYISTNTSTGSIFVSEGNCKIDMFAMWDRNLTTAEITELWNNGVGKSLFYTGEFPPSIQNVEYETLINISETNMINVSFIDLDDASVNATFFLQNYSGEYLDFNTTIEINNNTLVNIQNVTIFPVGQYNFTIVFTDDQNLSVNNTYVFTVADFDITTESYDLLNDLLTAYYPFDANKTYLRSLKGDESIYNLTEPHGYTVDSILGVIGEAPLFNNSGTSCGTCPVFTSVGGMTFNTNFSMSFWMLPGAYPFSDRIIFDLNNTLSFKLTAASGGLKFINLWDNNTNWTLSVPIGDLGSIDIYDGEWHHVVLIMNSTDNNTHMKQIYVDNELITTSELVGDRLPTSQLLSFGGIVGTNDSWYAGYLDEIGLFNDVVFNASIIDTLYNDGEAVEFLPLNVTINITDAYLNTLFTAWDVNLTYVNDVVTSYNNISTGTQSFSLNRSNGQYTFSAYAFENTTFPTTTETRFLFDEEKDLAMYMYDQIIVNLTFKNIITNALITGDNVSYDLIGDTVLSGNSTTGNGLINVTFDFYDIQGSVFGGTYADTEYYQQNLTYENIVNGVFPTFDLTMYFYDQTTANLANITATVFNSVGQPVENASVHVQRYDITSNSYVTTQIINTNNEGVTSFIGTLNDIKYKFKIFTDDQLRLNTAPSKLFSNSITFFISETSTLGSKYFITRDSLSHLLTYDPVTGVATLDYFNLIPPIVEVCLQVYDDPERILINETCLSTESGTININVVNTTAPGSTAIEVYASITGSPATNQFVDAISLYHKLAKLVGKLGLFLTIILVFVVLGISFWQPSLIPVTITAAFLGAGAMGLHTVPFPVSLGLLIVGFGITVYISDKA